MKKQSGFSLVELMVVLAIAAILLGLAAPSFSKFVKRSNVTTSVNAFLADTRYARSEAVRLGSVVTMCRSINSENASASGPTCASGSSVGWEGGWIVFLDRNRDGTRDYDADPTLDDTVLRRQGSLKSIDSIQETSGGGSTKIRFTPTGRLLTMSSNVTLQFGGSYDVDLGRKVCVSVGGRARIGTATDPCP